MKGFKDINVSKFERRVGNQELSMNISNQIIESNFYSALKSVKVNESQVFQSATHQEKNNLMLSPDLLPHCIQDSQQLKKSLISPYNNDHQPVLANLSMNGSLELLKYVFNPDENGVKFESIQQLTELRRDEENYDEPIAKLPRLIETNKKLSFIDFQWCPALIHKNDLTIAALTKSREIVFYSVKDRIATKEFSHQLDPSVLTIKWITSNKNKHYILTGEKKGDFTLHRIDQDKQHQIIAIKKVNEISCELKIAASQVAYETIGSNLLFIACKAHSIEAFLVSEKEVKSVKEYIGLAVTGITKVCKHKPGYMVSLLNGKVHYVEISVKDELQVVINQPVDTDSSDVSLSSYAIYGIAASPNKNFVYLAMQPQVPYDHLELRSPTCMAIYSFSRVNPIQVLTHNMNKTLLGYHDCVEHVRHLGGQDLRNMKMIEEFDVNDVDDSSIYDLKLALIAVRVRKSLSKMRSNQSYLQSHKVEIELVKLISCLSAVSLLRKVKLTKDNTNQVNSIRRCVSRYLASEIEVEKFKQIRVKLLPTIEKDLDKFTTKHGEIPVELCLMCTKPVNESTLCCDANHNLSRCMFTHQQLSTSNNNHCSHCYHPSSDQETLEKLTETKLCIFCDRYVIFQE